MLNHPQRSIVASLGNGRLGNQMANFASCYAIMKEYGMYHYLDSMQLKLLKNVFVMPELVDKDDASYYLWDPSKRINFKFCGIFLSMISIKDRLFDISYSIHLILSFYRVYRRKINTMERVSNVLTNR